MAKNFEKLFKAKAYKIWQKRQIEGREGNSNDDWEEAKKSLQSWSSRLLFKLEHSQDKFINLLTPIWIFGWKILPTSDWMKLLAAPLILSLAGAIISTSLQEKAKQNERLSKYFDEMQTLLLQYKLLDAETDSPVSLIAQAKSQNILRSVDTKSQELVISFLSVSDLTNRKIIRINLNFLDLKNIYLYGLNLSGGSFISANLSGATLATANLSGANFINADLSKAFVSSADLTNAYFNGAKLNGAKLLDAKLQGAKLLGAELQGANLRWAKLQGANLRWANFTNADLIDANLKGATNANLSGAKLCRTILPDGTTNNSSCTKKDEGKN